MVTCSSNSALSRSPGTSLSCGEKRMQLLTAEKSSIGQEELKNQRNQDGKSTLQYCGSHFLSRLLFYISLNRNTTALSTSLISAAISRKTYKSLEINRRRRRKARTMRVLKLYIAKVFTMILFWYCTWWGSGDSFSVQVENGKSEQHSQGSIH